MEVVRRGEGCGFGLAVVCGVGTCGRRRGRTTTKATSPASQPKWFLAGLTKVSKSPNTTPFPPLSSPTCGWNRDA